MVYMYAMYIMVYNICKMPHFNNQFTKIFLVLVQKKKITLKDSIKI